MYAVGHGGDAEHAVGHANGARGGRDMGLTLDGGLGSGAGAGMADRNGGHPMSIPRDNSAVEVSWLWCQAVGSGFEASRMAWFTCLNPGLTRQRGIFRFVGCIRERGVTRNRNGTTWDVDLGTQEHGIVTLLQSTGGWRRG